MSTTQERELAKKSTDPQVLAELAKISDLCAIVANNHNTNSETLAFLLGTDCHIDDKIASNPNTSVETLDKLLEYVKSNADSQVANYICIGFVKNPKIHLYDNIIQFILKHNYNYPKEILAENHNLSLNVLTQLSNERSSFVLSKLAQNPNISGELIRKLSTKATNVICSLLDNKNIDPLLISELSYHVDPIVREKVALNILTPVEILTKLSKDNNSSVVYRTLQNPNTPTNILDEIGKTSTHMSMISAIINNPNTSFNTLYKYYKEIHDNRYHQSILSSLVKHKDTTEEVLLELAKLDLLELNQVLILRNDLTGTILAQLSKSKINHISKTAIFKFLSEPEIKNK